MPRNLEAEIALAVAEYADAGITLDPQAVREALTSCSDEGLSRVRQLRHDLSTLLGR